MTGQTTLAHQSRTSINHGRQSNIALGGSRRQINIHSFFLKTLLTFNSVLCGLPKHTSQWITLKYT